MQPVDDAAKLLKQLVSEYELQLEHYEEWLRLARQVQARLDDEELDAFLRLHRAKNAVTEKLQKREGPLKSQRDDLAARLGVDDFTMTALEQAAATQNDVQFNEALVQWRRLLARLNAVMDELQRVERETERRLRARLRSLHGDISGVKTTRHAARAYDGAAPGADEAQFIDHKG